MVFRHLVWRIERAEIFSKELQDKFCGGKKSFNETFLDSSDSKYYSSKENCGLLEEIKKFS